MPNKFTNQEQREHWNRYNARYAKDNYVSVSIKLSKNKDKDIVDYLESLSVGTRSRSDVVKSIIRKAIENKQD